MRRRPPRSSLEAFYFLVCVRVGRSQWGVDGRRVMLVFLFGCD